VAEVLAEAPEEVRPGEDLEEGPQEEDPVEVPVEAPRVEELEEGQEGHLVPEPPDPAVGQAQLQAPLHRRHPEAALREVMAVRR
jgi:hypothetical protein